MDKIIVKKKEFNILEKIGDHFYKAERKGKYYAVRSFNKDSEEFETFMEHYKKLKVAGLNLPKLYKADKNEKTVALEYIEGERVIDLIIKGDLDKEIYRSIFTQAWYSNHEMITINFMPDKWIYSNKKLFYMAYDYKDGLKENETFDQHGLKYWVYTKELVDYLKTLNLPVDKSRLKEPYETNKEMVLLVCQYHI